MFERISLKLVELVSQEEGQGATEYAMVIGFLIVGLTLGLAALGLGINDFLEEVAGALPSVG